MSSLDSGCGIVCCVLESGVVTRISGASSKMQVEKLGNIKCISIGKRHLLALDDGGTVWAAGDNEDSQIGFSSTNVPKRIPKITNIIQIGAGNQFSLFLDERGVVFLLGTEYNVIHRRPCALTCPVIVDISVSDFRYLLLDHCGCVWASGDNNANQLGLGPTVTDTAGLELIIDLPPVKYIRTSLVFSLFIDLEGFLWACGHCFAFDRQVSSTEAGAPIHKVPGSPLVSRIYCKSRSVYVITVEGEVWQTKSPQLTVFELTSLENINSILKTEKLYILSNKGEVSHIGYSGVAHATISSAKLDPSKSFQIQPSRAKSARK